ncbi:MAG: glycine cleavage system aminomethyltransferase GcvT [Candidatus Dadabacteria bacterium]|nr:MAG: glycine cleavage system aminomethyltransferase GcvT [Candidatus Dadabacteria bacterium]
MVPFAGWEMPVQYTGVKAEHTAVRTTCGLFDVSHMGTVLLQGGRATEALERLTPWPMSKLKPGRARYTVMLNEAGGTVDDLIVYRRGNEDWFVIWNAANHQKNLDWTAPILTEYGVTLEDLTSDTALIALQGPDWHSVWEQALPGAAFPDKRFTFTEHDGMLIARTGYTGEDGVEIWCPNARAIELWDRLIDAGATPCGLGARDSLRIEAGLPLYGHELSDEIGPIEGGVGFVVHKDHHGYIGEMALQRDPRRCLAGVRMTGRGVPREGYPVLTPDGETIGAVTSGSYSPILDTGIGLALVDRKKSGYDGTSQAVAVEIRGRSFDAELVVPPLHKN